MPLTDTAICQAARETCKASARLNEMGWAPDVIERKLTHAEPNKVRAAYNRAQYMAERRKLMRRGETIWTIFELTVTWQRFRHDVKNVANRGAWMLAYAATHCVWQPFFTRETRGT